MATKTSTSTKSSQPWLHQKGAQIQQFVEQLSRWMDAAFEVPGLGWRFGWDALIGLVPGVGDVATTLVALYIVAMAGKVGLPRVTVARMGLNVDAEEADRSGLVSRVAWGFQNLVLTRR